MREQHAIELQALNCRIDQLQVNLDFALAEKASLVEASKRTESEHAAAMVELQRELAAATTHAHRSSQSAAELRQQCGSLQKKIDELKKNAVDRQSQDESEIKKLRQTIEQSQDAVAEETRRRESIECALREECDTLRERVERLTSEAIESGTQHASQISELQQTIKEHRNEIQQLALKAGQTSKDLDRKEDALQRLRSKNERILEIHDSQFTTLQSRIDDLVVALDLEKEKRKTAEAEARSLCHSRSQRLVFLGQQREQLLAQTSQLRKSVKQQGNATKLLGSENEQLVSENQQLQSENQQLQSENQQLQSENQKMGNANELLQSESKRLHSVNELLGNDIKQLGAENKQLGAENKQLGAENKQLGVENKQLGAENKQLGAENKQLGVENKQLGVENKQLGAENKQLGAENKQLGAENKQLGVASKRLVSVNEQLSNGVKQLRAKESRLRSIAETTTQSLKEATDRLGAQADEISQLREQLTASAAAESKKLKHSLEKHAVAKRDVVRLTGLLDQANEKLQTLHQQLAEQPSAVGSEDVEFAMAQRDRTIALLEREASLMQERLQREAAARRKAESAIKRKVKAAPADTAAHDAWSQIDASEQVSRLKRQIVALQNVCLLERQRAAAEISRHKKCIARLQQKFGKRAA